MKTAHSWRRSGGQYFWLWLVYFTHSERSESYRIPPQDRGLCVSDWIRTPSNRHLCRSIIKRGPRTADPKILRDTRLESSYESEVWTLMCLNDSHSLSVGILLQTPLSCVSWVMCYTVHRALSNVLIWCIFTNIFMNSEWKSIIISWYWNWIVPLSWLTRNMPIYLAL